MAYINDIILDELLKLPLVRDGIVIGEDGKLVIPLDASAFDWDFVYGEEVDFCIDGKNPAFEEWREGHNPYSHSFEDLPTLPYDEVLLVAESAGITDAYNEILAPKINQFQCEIFKSHIDDIDGDFSNGFKIELNNLPKPSISEFMDVLNGVVADLAKTPDSE